MQRLVHKGVLDLFDQYDGDFELLYERWARKEDREKYTSEQLRTLSQYVDKLQELRVERLSADYRARLEAEVERLESNIDEDVIRTLKARTDRL